VSIRNLDALYRPGAIALIGGSASPGAVGRIVAENLLRAGFDGPIMPVHPTRRAVSGVLAYPRVADLPVTPDLGVVATPPDAVASTVAELGERGARAAVILTAGFGEDGSETGAARQRAVLEAARPHTLRVLGPNCLGVISPRQAVNASFAAHAPAPGDLALVTQSGAMAMAMLEWARPRGIGFSHIVSLGDMADVDFGDCLDYLAHDPRTRAILLYVEAITDARKFMSAARAAARTKPVIVIKGGRHAEGAHAAARHTGAAAGRDAVYDAAFRRAGMLRVDSLNELFDAAATLAMSPPVKGDRMTIVTNGGGPGVLAADALVDGGGALTELSTDTVATLDGVLPAAWSRRNPVDILGDADAERYASALKTILAQRGGDAVLVINAPGPSADPVATADAVARAMGGRRRPVFAAWLSGGNGEPHRIFAANRVPSYAAPEDAVRGFLHLVRHRRSQDNLMETPPALPDHFVPDTSTAAEIVAGARADRRTVLTADETARVLDAYNLPQVRDDGRPTDGIRLAMGMRTEPPFGPVLLFGQGGPAWGARHDIAVGLPPLNLALARRMIAETRVAEVLDGNGEGTAEAAALALVALAQLTADRPEIAELDVNPMVACDGGIAVTAARIALQPADAAIPESGESCLAIRPYPQHLARTVTTRRGFTATLRPIRPEDEPALQALVQRLDPDDVRLRFFSPMRELSHTFAARLTQIDYDREMAFVAVNPADDGEMYGVVRLTCDPDNIEGEYAVMVRSDLKGRGLGYTLMETIIGHARERGIEAIVGDVLTENTGMLAMCRELGFKVRHSPDDPQVMRVRLTLAPPVKHDRATDAGSDRDA
jgi:acetyltransferase